MVRGSAIWGRFAPRVLMSCGNSRWKRTTYGWAVEMILKGSLAGYRIVEVPVSYYPRIGEIENQWHIAGYGRCGMVHPQPDRALLFRAPGSVTSEDTAILYGAHRD